MLEQVKTCKTCKNSFKTLEDFMLNSNGWAIGEHDSFWFNCNCGSTLLIREDSLKAHKLMKKFKGTINNKESGRSIRELNAA